MECDRDEKRCHLEMDLKEKKCGSNDISFETNMEHVPIITYIYYETLCSRYAFGTLPEDAEEKKGGIKHESGEDDDCEPTGGEQREDDMSRNSDDKDKKPMRKPDNSDGKHKKNEKGDHSRKSGNCKPGKHNAGPKEKEHDREKSGTPEGKGEMQNDVKHIKTDGGDDGKGEDDDCEPAGGEQREDDMSRNSDDKDEKPMRKPDNSDGKHKKNEKGDHSRKSGNCKPGKQNAGPKEKEHDREKSGTPEGKGKMQNGVKHIKTDDGDDGKGEDDDCEPTGGEQREDDMSRNSDDKDKKPMRKPDNSDGKHKKNEKGDHSRKSGNCKPGKHNAGPKEKEHDREKSGTPEGKGKMQNDVKHIKTDDGDDGKGEDDDCEPTGGEQREDDMSRNSNDKDKKPMRKPDNSDGKHKKNEKGDHSRKSGNCKPGKHNAGPKEKEHDREKSGTPEGKGKMQNDVKHIKTDDGDDGKGEDDDCEPTGGEQREDDMSRNSNDKDKKLMRKPDNSDGKHKKNEKGNHSRKSGNCKPGKHNAGPKEKEHDREKSGKPEGKVETQNEVRPVKTEDGDDGKGEDGDKVGQNDDFFNSDFFDLL